MLLSPPLVRLATNQAMSTCPNCGQHALRRSHVRFYEKLRKALSSNRPYRCTGCRVRVWGPVPQAAATVGPQGAGGEALEPSLVTEPLDLSALDRALSADRLTAISAK